MGKRSSIHVVCLIFFVVALVLIVRSSATAQEEPVFHTEKLSDNIFRAWTDDGNYTTNILISVGKDGLLLVDSNTEERADALKTLVESFGKGVPKFIINTHRHVEHVGGNAVFGGAPVIIAHELVPKKLRSGSYLFSDFPDETFPDITFNDSLFLNFNGEQIRMVFIGGSHDDNEIMVHFVNSKVVHLSSVINGMNFPSIDSDGDLLQFAPIVERAMKLLPEDVTIVSGHNGLAKYSDLFEYRDMINETIEIVRKGIAEGKDLEQMQDEKLFANYDRFNQSYVSPEGWMESIYERLTKDESKPAKKELYDPLYYAIKDGGVEAGVQKYITLKKEYPEDYEFSDVPLLIIGDKLLEHEQYDGAKRFLDLCRTEYPDGRYLYYVDYELALIAKEQGDISSAIESCKMSLELRPEFGLAKTLLEELKQEN